MKEQWKKTGFWFLMSVLTVMFIFIIPPIIFVTVICFTNFLCYLVSAIVVSINHNARPYLCYTFTAVFISLLLSVYLARDIASEGINDILAAGDMMIIIFFVPILLFMAFHKYKSGKKEEMIQNGGDNYGEKNC
ncbi:hypothetical protein [Ruminococcus flavefaciens]|uniref:hypothetical protein n=1 Tax=Ruminococcus flavefaciens TaxID=1265 RepID=UPI0026EF1616|nr:hypothetical protein [Ruminococcus flavefaciens]MDD7515500.1 hypothetical protein [Ruminococcus flavefaciens]MDY5690193.1 hypothetical protein [Ruminococcus flavefaciens]